MLMPATQESPSASLNLVPELSEVSRARAFVSSVASTAGFSEEKIFDISVASSEATANAIEHSPIKGQVQVETILRPDRLEVLIQGAGEFQTPDRQKERTNRGMGLPLMAKLSDHLAMYSNPGGGTLVTLTFYLPGVDTQRQDEPLPPFIRELMADSARLESVIRAEEEAATGRRRAELLSDSAARLLASRRPRELVGPLCLRVMSELDCQVFFNFLMDADKGRLHLNAYAGIPQEEARAIQYLDFGAAVCGCAANERRPIVAEDVLSSSDPRMDMIKSYGVQAFAAHPLIAEGRVIGTLSFGTRSRAKFTQDDLDLMWGMVSSVSAAMNRIQIDTAFREADRKYRELFSLRSGGHLRDRFSHATL
jgi:anti-sigma regulatory factor (Ser/Thr protein kinase)/putative methionine-R-sulfoxide reductase with GAF domain